MNKKNFCFQPKWMVLALLSSPFSAVSVVYADTVDHPNAAQQAELETVTVKGKKRVGRKDNEVTGLGKVVKSIQDINQEQILGIRDLTRYDPGISVVEQGRGATSGYAMRGVDKNRVALLVDGLPQAQSYSTLFSQANGGAINEIEYENIRSIELSKGASSAEYGNGALGGAVGFRTKEPNDVIKEGQNWGLDTKSAYSSKNNQFTQSFALAGRANGFDGLAIFTHRKGKETEAHRAAGDYTHTFTRLSGYADEYDMRNGTTANQRTLGWFLIRDECPSLNCAPKADARVTRDEPITLRTKPPLTPEELANRMQSVHRQEQVSAKDYTGKDRILPNPMDYQTQSWFFKGGYHFSPEHYLGGVYEHTKQRYDIRDMSVPAYYEPAEDRQANIKSYPYRHHVLEGLAFNWSDAQPGLNWTRTRFFDERHRKTRKGVFYQYTNSNKTGWLDKLDVSFDRQHIGLDSSLHDRRCAVYPTVDKSCRASVDKPWSYYQSERNHYREERDLFRLGLEKAFKWGNTTHHLGFLAGTEKQKSVLQRSDYQKEYAKAAWVSAREGLTYIPNGAYDRPYVYAAKPVEIIQHHFCDYSGVAADLRDCNPRTITGRNHFFALRDHIAFGKYADLGLGLRYDYHRFHSNDKWTSAGTYRNWSWNSGLTLKPTDYLALSYRVSNGFRVPAFYEMFGRRVQGKERTSELADQFQHVAVFRPEKSFNQEWGVGLKGDFGYLETSYFYNRYRDMIALAERRGLVNNQFGYHNVQDVTLHGVNVLGKIDWNGVHQALPEGLYSTVAYNQVKVKKRHIDPAFTNTSDPILDAVQPGRYVLGLGYDHPSGKWGINSMMTYSKEKRNDELTGQRYVGGTAYDATGKRTKRWYTYDLTAYLNVKKFLTLRAGIYNLTNRKYSTWESVRQSSLNAVNPDGRTHHASYAASGRNFVLSMEMKF